MHLYKNNLERRGKHDISIPTVISIKPSNPIIAQEAKISSLSETPKIRRNINKDSKREAQLRMLTLNLPSVVKLSCNSVENSRDSIKTNKNLKMRKRNRNINYHKDCLLYHYIPNYHFTKTQEDVFKRNINRKSLGDYVKVLNTFNINKHIPN